MEPSLIQFIFRSHFKFYFLFFYFLIMFYWSSVNYIYVRLWLVGVQCLYLRILRSYILVFGNWGVVGVYVYLTDT